MGHLLSRASTNKICWAGDPEWTYLPNSDINQTMAQSQWHTQSIIQLPFSLFRPVILAEWSLSAPNSSAALRCHVTNHSEPQRNVKLEDVKVCHSKPFILGTPIFHNVHQLLWHHSTCYIALALIKLTLPEPPGCICHSPQVKASQSSPGATAWFLSTENC